MPFDANDPALRDSTVRKGEFRETARDIVWKDRQSKKFGPSTDTGGAITRAMEQAYKLGLEHGRQPQIETPAADPDGPLAWKSIPPKPRSLYERILSLGWIVVLQPRSDPWVNPKDKWACYWDWGEKRGAKERIEYADAFSTSTLAPLIKLGLMIEQKFEGKVFLEQTAKGKATWQRAIDEGHVRPARPL